MTDSRPPSIPDLPGVRRPPAQVGPAPITDPRLLLVLRIEKTMLAARYLAYFLMIGLFAFGYALEPARAFFFLGTAGLMHNVFAHWALRGERSFLFQSPLNFAVYLAEITLLVAITGGAASPLFALYLLFIIGHGIYSRHFRGAAGVTLLCALCYGAVLLGEHYRDGLALAPEFLGIKMLSIIACGWLMGTLNEFLQTTEADLDRRAGELAASEASLRMILDSAAMPILVAAESEIIVEVNDRACEFLHTPRRSLIGQRFRRYLFDDGALPAKLAVLRARGAYEGEAVLLRPGGEDRAVVLHVRSFLRGDKRFYVCMWHDITEQKNLQETARLARRRLEEINRELQRISTLRAAYFAQVSRRLRSPLTAILGGAAMLLDETRGNLSELQRRTLRNIRASAARVFQLVDEADLMAEEIAKPRPDADANGGGQDPGEPAPQPPEESAAAAEPGDR